jgi:uncharacterized coiled-coil DUF342 family protein
MDGSEAEMVRRSDQTAGGEMTPEERQAEAQEAAEGLRDQIAALRRRVREAQDTLREHAHRRRGRRPPPKG